MATTEFFWFQQLSANGELVDTDKEERVEVEKEEKSKREIHLLPFNVDGIFTLSKYHFSITKSKVRLILGSQASLKTINDQLYILFCQLRIHP